MAVAALLVAAGPAAASLVPNGSFEQIDAKGRPVGWRFRDYGTGATGRLVEAGADGTGHCVVIQCASSKQRGSWAPGELPIKPYQGLKVSLAYRTDLRDGRPGASVRVTWLRAGKGWDFLSDSRADLPPTESWTRAERSFIAPPGAARAVVELFNFWAAGTVYFDDVAVTIMGENERDATLHQLLDRPPAEREVGYRPRDGATVGVTPPSFSWVPAKGFKYAVQWSQSKNFPDAETVRGLELTIYTPDHALRPGRWYWRYGLDLGEKVVWGRTRSFVVPEGAPELPLDIPALIKNLPAGHPRLWVRADELAAWRERMKTDPGFQKILRQAEHLLTVDPSTIPEPRPYNDEEKADKKKRVAHWREMRGQATRAGHNAWTLGLAYMATGDSRFGEAGRRWLMHVCSWDPNGTTTLHYNDEAGMPLIYSIPRAYDWLYPVLSESDRAKVREVYKVRGGEAYAILRHMPFHYNPYSSHPGRFINFLGEGAICFYGEIPEAAEWLDYILRCYVAVYPAWGDEDGGWAEGPNYWKWYIQRTFVWLFAARKALGIHIERRPFFRNTGYFKLYTNPPNSGMSPFGDACSESRPNATDKTVMWHFGELFNKPEFKWYAQQIHGDLQMPLNPTFCGPDRVPARAPVDLPDARLFRGIGVVAMHSALEDPTSDIMVLFKSSPYGSYSHSHADQNSFYLQAGGEPLFIDSGWYPWYSSPHHHNWTRETKAHNCITFDGGEGQIKRSKSANGHIVAFATTDDFHYAAGDATAAYGGKLKRFVRHVLFARPDCVFIFDDVAADEPHRWEWWLHALDPMQIDEARQVVRAAHGRAKAACAILWPSGLSFKTWCGFAPPPENGRPDQCHCVATVAKPTREQNFVAAIAAGLGDAPLPEASLDRAANYFAATLRRADGSRAVAAFRTKPGGEIRAGRIHADAAVLAAQYAADGRLRASFTSQAAAIRNASTVLVQSTHPATVSLRYLDGVVVVRWSGAEDSTLRLRVDFSPRLVVLDGKALPPDAWQFADGYVAVALTRGSHTLVVAASEKVALPGPAGEVPVVAEGKTLARLSAYRGWSSLTASGTLPLDDPLLCRPRLILAPGAKVSPDAVTLRLGRVLVEHWRADKSGLVARWPIVVDPQSAATLTVADLDMSVRNPVAAVELSDPLRPVDPPRVDEMPDDGIVIEAEDFCDEGRGHAAISRGGHVDEHGGASVFGNTGDGHWLEWKFSVPEDGEYDLFIRAACGDRWSLRELRIDRKLPARGFACIRFPGTGGWAHQKGEWWAFHVAGGRAELPPLRLSAGEHRLRLRGLDAGHLNLDYFVLRKR